MTTNQSTHTQRTWARVAGLMYWAVLLVDLTGMQLRPPLRSTLLLTGSVLTVPLALGLFYALRPVQPALATVALAFRLLEAALGTIGFLAVHAPLAPSTLSTALVRLAAWNDQTAFAAFVFTIASTIFFFLFVKSRYIPRVLAWWGLFASVVALAACLTHLLRPAFPAMTMLAWIPMLLAETSTGLWLLVKSLDLAGVRSQATPDERSAVPAATL